MLPVSAQQDPCFARKSYRKALDPTWHWTTPSAHRGRPRSSCHTRPQAASSAPFLGPSVSGSCWDSHEDLVSASPPAPRTSFLCARRPRASLSKRRGPTPAPVRAEDAVSEPG
eukprot:285588-Rhodomonas_salina.1